VERGGYMKNTRTLKIRLIPLLCLFSFLFLFACTQYPNEPPPNYKIVCDHEKGYFAPQMPGGHIIVEDYNGRPFKTRQEAVNQAWKLYEFRPLPEKKYNWQTCD